MRDHQGKKNPNWSHGRSKTRTYSIWKAMRKRCNNPNTNTYHRYGGRGITVCERWNDFQNFLADMGEAPAGKSIEREDNDKGYEPGNCYWATPLEQAANTMKNRTITIGGETHHLAEWARRLGMRSDAGRMSVLWKRLKSC